MKRISALILGVLLLAALAVPAGAAGAGIPHVVDNAGVLDREQHQTLEKRAKSLSQKYAFDFVILTVQSTGTASAEQYADDFYDFNDYGFGEDYDGILLLVSIADRKWQLSASGFGETAFTPYGEGVMMDEVLPYMKDGDYAGAFGTFLTQSESLLKQARSGRPLDEPEAGGFPIGSLLVCAVLGFGLAFAPMSVLKKQVRNVGSKADAMDYVTQPLELEHQADRFLYSTVMKRPRPKQESSSGGNSSRRSSSGRSHSGTGGSF